MLQNERRPYVELEQRRFHPTDLGEVVSKLLVRVLPDIFDVGYTRDVELELDQIGEGKPSIGESGLKTSTHALRDGLEGGRRKLRRDHQGDPAADGETCDKCDSAMLVRWNRYGRFWVVPPIQIAKVRSLDGFNPDGDELGVHPVEGRMICFKYGPYVMWS